MEIKFYTKLPVYAVDIRNEVFVKEQGFREEFDSDDKIATHIVGFVDDRSVATARILKLENYGFLIGRVAVRKAYRGMGLGAQIISAAEASIKQRGGKEIFIHSQQQAIPFYSKQGYFPIGDPDDEEGCPHQMLHKLLY